MEVQLYHAYLLCELDDDDEEADYGAGGAGGGGGDGSPGGNDQVTMRRVGSSGSPLRRKTSSSSGGGGGGGGGGDMTGGGVDSGNNGDAGDGNAAAATTTRQRRRQRASQQVVSLRNADAVFGATAAVLDACSAYGGGGGLSSLLFDAGVDLAGRAWIVAALGEGVLEDRLYALAANPRRTRNFYEPNAVLREPNDSSRLLWLVERLSAVDFGAHTRARHAFPALPALVKSLDEQRKNRGQDSTASSRRASTRCSPRPRARTAPTSSRSKRRSGRRRRADATTTTVSWACTSLKTSRKSSSAPLWQRWRRRPRPRLRRTRRPISSRRCDRSTRRSRLRLLPASLVEVAVAVATLSTSSSPNSRSKSCGTVLHPEQCPSAAAVAAAAVTRICSWHFRPTMEARRHPHPSHLLRRRRRRRRRRRPSSSSAYMVPGCARRWAWPSSWAPPWAAPRTPRGGAGGGGGGPHEGSGAGGAGARERRLRLP